MTVTALVARFVYNGDGSTVTFPAQISGISGSAVKVSLIHKTSGLETALVYGSDYNVTGTDGNYNAVLNTAPSSSYWVVVWRSSSLNQPTSFVNSNVEQAFDRVARRLQEVADVAGRSLTLPKSETTTPADLPIAVLRASKLLGFDATGTPVLYNMSQNSVFTGVLSVAQGGTGASDVSGAQSALDITPSAQINKKGTANTWTLGQTFSAGWSSGGDCDITGKLDLNANNTGGAGTALNRLTFTDLDTTTVGDQPIGEIRFNISDATAASSLAGRFLMNSAGVDGGSYFSWFNSTSGGAAVEKMRLDNLGVLRTLGTILTTTFATNPSILTMSSAAANTGNVGMECQANSTAARHHISFATSAGIVGSISTNASATAYNTSSDYRLKENLAPMNDAVARVMALNPTYFTWVGNEAAGVWEGMLAHELALVVPTAVAGTKDQIDEDGNPSYQSVDYSKLVPLLTAALKTALGEIDALKARVTTLEGP